MNKLESFFKGISQFSKTNEADFVLAKPFVELTRLLSSAVAEDKAIQDEEFVGLYSLTLLYLQRLRELGSMFTEVFIYQEYNWQPKCDNPRIIDLGGDIGGFTILYWKSIAPKAHVTVVEANPATANVMRAGIAKKDFLDVEVINAAITEEGGKDVNLYLSGYNPSNFAGNRGKLDDSKYRIVSVPSLKLSDVIGDKKVDLLKMDIEGQECGAFRDLHRTGKLDLINEVMVEFHNDPNNPANSLVELTDILINSGFSIKNVHIAGIERLTNYRTIELNDISPEDTILISFTATKLN